MELNVNINEAAIVDGVVQKLLLSPKFWELLRGGLKAHIYQKAADEFEEQKRKLFETASETLSIGINSRMADAERSLKTKVDIAISNVDLQIRQLTNSLVQKATEHLDASNLNRMLGALIREMHGQQLGALIAKSVEKMSRSLNEE